MRIALLWWTLAGVSMTQPVLMRAATSGQPRVPVTGAAADASGRNDGCQAVAPQQRQSASRSGPPSSQLSPSRTPSSKGIWTSAAELRHLPTRGPAWQAVSQAADAEIQPNLGDHNSDADVRTLAAAIVYARTGKETYRHKVQRAIESVVQQGKPEDVSLPWARNIGAYAIAADTVGYHSQGFRTYLENIASEWVAEDGRTLTDTFHTRPNNWGSHAFGALCAIYAYLGDREALAAVRQYWIRAVEGPNRSVGRRTAQGMIYGSDLSWHADPENLRWINPAGAEREGICIDGFIPDDMRRGGPLQDPPEPTGYAWGGQQGWILAARVLERQGMPIWEVADRAIFRAAHALQIRLGREHPQWRAKGDDLWMLPFLDDAYDSELSAGVNSDRLWQHGKNAGWPYVLGAGNAPRPSTQ